MTQMTLMTLFPYSYRARESSIPGQQEKYSYVREV